MLKLGLSAPWYTYRNKLASIFNGDEEVEVGQISQESKSTYSINMEVSNAEKACALNQLIPVSTKMGNITVKVNILVPNGSVDTDVDDIDLEAAFSGNPNIDAIKSTLDPFGNTWVFVMFKKSTAIAQFYNDDITDPYGNFNGLLSDIAREIFVNVPRVNYSVDI